MVYILSFILIIAIAYPSLTLLYCAYYDYLNENKRFVIPIGGLLKECLLQIIVFIYLPFDMVRDWDHKDSASNEFVFLLPGYTETEFIFWRLKRSLKANNIGYKVIKYKPFFGDLERQTLLLNYEIDFLVERNNNCNIHLVGHSMGGLVGRLYCENYQDNRVQNLIMVSTPHNGTLLSIIGYGTSAKQMRPGSDLIENLKNEPIENAINIYSISDSLVCPRSSCKYLKNNFKIRNQALHNSTMFESETIDLIINHLRDGKNTRIR